MSIYHLNMSNVSRAHGSSSCATLSYISGRAVREERTGQTYSYGRAERVVCTNTMTPDFAPADFRDAAKLFNSIEDFERNENARTAKKIEVALPREFDLKTARSVVEDYIQRNFVNKGYCATYAIHLDKDGNNPHCHILIPNRQIAKDGSWNAKRKMTYALDDRGNRVPLIDPKTGAQKVDSRGRKAWKRINAVANPLDDRQTLKQLRAAWAEVCNERLQPADHIDARSYADQGVEKIPTVHEGYAARAIAEAGGISERVELNKQIREANAELMRIAAERQTCYANLIVLQQEQAEAARAAARAAEEKRQEEGAAALAKIEQLFRPEPTPEKKKPEADEDRRIEQLIKQKYPDAPREQIERVRDMVKKQLQEKKEQDAAEREQKEYWNDRLGGMDWRQLEEFCKGEYQQRREGAHEQARRMWVDKHFDQVTDYFNKCRDKAKADFADWQRKNPRPPEPVERQGNFMTRKIFKYWYKCSDWKDGDRVYDDTNYNEYRDRQKLVVKDWGQEREQAQQPIKQAEQELQYCKNHDIDSIIKLVDKDYAISHQRMYSGVNPPQRHGTLFSMIEQGARKLIDTLKDFAPVRAMISVVNALSHDRAEDRRRDLAAEREQQRTRQQGRGGYGRGR